MSDQCVTSVGLNYVHNTLSPIVNFLFELKFLLISFDIEKCQFIKSLQNLGFMYFLFFFCSNATDLSMKDTFTLDIGQSILIFYSFLSVLKYPIGDVYFKDH